MYFRMFKILYKNATSHIFLDIVTLPYYQGVLYHNESISLIINLVSLTISHLWFMQRLYSVLIVDVSVEARVEYQKLNQAVAPRLSGWVFGVHLVSLE